MNVTILCVEYLDDDGIVFDAFRDVFPSDLVQVRGMVMLHHLWLDRRA